jgi:hypothetical protein
VGVLNHCQRGGDLVDVGGDAHHINHALVFGQDVFGHFGLQFLASHAIAQGNGDGFFGGILADNVFVQFDDDLPRSQFVERREHLCFFDLLVTRQVNHHSFL